MGEGWRAKSLLQAVLPFKSLSSQAASIQNDSRALRQTFRQLNRKNVAFIENEFRKTLQGIVVNDLTSSQPTAFQPVPMAGLKALLASAFCGLCLAAVSIWLDFVVISAFLTGFSALCLPVIYGATSRLLVVRAVIGIIGTVLGLSGLWLLHFSLEFSWEMLVEQLQFGPVAFIDHFTSASSRFQGSVSFESGRSSEGPSSKMMAWMAATAILGMMPIVGALQGPKPMQTWRAMRDRRRSLRP